jgi:hypothetical protein
MDIEIAIVKWLVAKFMLLIMWVPWAGVIELVGLSLFLKTLLE